MNNTDYTATMEAKKPSDEVFSSICQVPHWWSKDFDGSSTNLNDEFIIHHPGQHYSKQKLIEIIPNQRIVWLVTESKLYWLNKDRQEWTNTKMRFELQPGENKTIIRFTHEGLTPHKECYSMCEQGWNIVIKNWLLHYITTGKSSSEMERAGEIRNRILKS